MRLTFPGADVDAAHRWMGGGVCAAGWKDRDRAAALTGMNEALKRRVSENIRSRAAGDPDTLLPLTGLLLHAAACLYPGRQRPLATQSGNKLRAGRSWFKQPSVLKGIVLPQNKNSVIIYSPLCRWRVGGSVSGVNSPIHYNWTKWWALL